jgi:hypothetical protein
VALISVRPSSDSSLSTASIASSNDIPPFGFDADRIAVVAVADDEDASTEADADADDENASTGATTADDDAEEAEEFDAVEECACRTGTESK